jgi:chromosome segregation ATPase
MDEALKNRFILILGILCVILLAGNISSCSNSMRQKNARDKEMYTRLELEEKMAKVSQQIAVLEEKLKARDSECESQKTRLEAVTKSLVEEQLANTALKDELQKVTALKKALEEDLKEISAKKKK